jgi:hypothetical protein
MMQNDHPKVAKKARIFIGAGLIFFICASGLFAQDILINEILASNASINSDPDYGVFSDWIEIYNAGDQAVELDGYFLTDDATNWQKWRFPDNIIIQGRGFVFIWADGMDNQGSSLHSNFNLKKSGEHIGLYDAQGRLVDSLSYTAQTTDVSFGRNPDGGNEWVFFEQSTPHAPNGGDVFLKSAAPKFSISSGFYEQEQTIVLSTDDPDAAIHYTLDCSDPSKTSPVYDSPLIVKNRTGEANFFSEIRTSADPEPWLPDWVSPASEVFKATVVRARAFKSGYIPSNIETHTYFIDPDMMTRYPTIAVISLVSDYKNLFADATGLYVPGNTHRNGDTRSGNYFQGWEKPAHIEFFEGDGDPAFSQEVGIKIQGGSSPVSPQKGLHVFARNEYGDNRINYPIFANTRFAAREIQQYKRFIIRAWGSTINAALFNDAYAQALVADTDIDLNAYRPAVLFINGEYWGLHEIREANKNSWYYQFHYDVDRENPGCDIVEFHKQGGQSVARVDEGDAQHWNKMRQFLETHDMSAPENYAYIKTQMDVDNFIEYIGHAVYLSNWDWPNNNEASWRPRTVNGKWRWVLYDMETSFGVATALNPIYANLGASFDMIHNLIYGTPIIGFGLYGPHPVLIRLLENREFKNAFVKWFYDNMKTRYAPANMTALLDDMAAEIEPYLPEYRERWPFVTSMNNDWNYHLDLIKTFAKERPAYMTQHLINEFGAETDVLDNRDSALPVQFELAQNAPNPFNGSTIIEFVLPQSEFVSIKIYNIAGRNVEKLLDARTSAGKHSVRWLVKDVSSGIYYLRFIAGEHSELIKMVVMQ